jgi:urease accessory protein
MLRATATSHHGETVDSITLDHEQRHRRRAALVSDGGLEFLLDLPQAAHLHDGTRLLLEDGRRIAVRAAAEPVLDIRSPDLARIAWHLGNRHTPAQIFSDRLRIRDDHVLAEMLQGLGAEVVALSAPFEPESGAYAHGHHGH